jgi:DNA topoisomerase I
MKLIIVESPAKCGKIVSFLGADKYICKASYGHIRQLKKSLSASIDIKNSFKPTYIISPEKEKVVKELLKAIKKADEVIIATDPDREGEAIGWHLAQVLNLDVSTTKRIAFNAITKKAVNKALQDARTLDMDLINAQQARVIIDKLVGFEVSPVLWKHIKSSLSAGRCQSPALRLLYEREQQIDKFSSSSYFKISGIFYKKDKKKCLEGSIAKSFTDGEAVKKILKNYQKKVIFKIKGISKSNSVRNPSPPFTTSTMQQEASSKLSIGPKEAMSLAQKLYEQGYITYMRTDSVVMENDAVEAIDDYVKDKFGEKYRGPADICNKGSNSFKGRIFKTKSKSSQEAHEAIRPVKFDKLTAPEALGSRSNRLYQLIWKRAVASQMASMIAENYKIDIENNKDDELFNTSIQKIIFDGYTKVYGDSDAKNSDNIALLNSISIGDKVQYAQITGEEKYTKPTGRFTESNLIKELEKLGIGRPSTYSGIITKIQDRKYAEKKSGEGKEVEITELTLKDSKLTSISKKIRVNKENNKLFISDIGKMVSKFLNEHFNEIVDYNMTSELEEKLDKIASGEENWVETITHFYNIFHPNVVKLNDTDSEKVRILGTDEDGSQIQARIGKYGPVIAVKYTDFRQKMKFASLDEGQDFTTITLQEAKKLLQYPKKLGKHNKKEVTLNKGQYGYYVKYDDQNFTVGKKLPDKMDLDAAIAIIEGNGNDSNNPGERNEDGTGLVGKYNDIPIYIANGRFGTYMKYNQKNYPLKGYNPEDLDLQQAIKIISDKDKIIVKEFNKEISIRNGKKGNSQYIMVKQGKGRPTFVPLDKSKNGKNMTLEEVQQIILDYANKSNTVKDEPAKEEKDNKKTKKLTKKIVRIKKKIKKESKVLTFD